MRSDSRAQHPSVSKLVSARDRAAQLTPSSLRWSSLHTGNRLDLTSVSVFSPDRKLRPVTPSVAYTLAETMPRAKPASL